MTCDNPRMRTFAEDARPWLERSEGGYDAIMVDAYRQPYIPFYLATREFFELARDRLAPGGLVIVNVGHPEGNDDLETVLGRTMAEAFPSVLRYPIEDTNTLLVAGRGVDLPGRGCARSARRCPRPPAGARAPRRRGARAAARRAARSTPTIAPRSSGWSTPRCSDTPNETRRGPTLRAWLVTGAAGQGPRPWRSTSSLALGAVHWARRGS